MKIKVWKSPLVAGLELPSRAYLTDGGYDLRTAVDLTVAPGECVDVPTGLFFDLPTKEFRLGGVPHRLVMRIDQRTGVASKGLFAAATVVDSGYRPDPKHPEGLVLRLRNVGTETLSYARGDRVAQALFLLVCTPKLEEAPQDKIFWDTDRGPGRFSSTGLK